MRSRNLTAIAPLAPSQLGMLIQALGASDPGVHVEQLSWPLRGPVRHDLMDAAWAAVAADCEALRTGFIVRDEGEPLQYVLRSAVAEVERVDLSGLDPRAKQPALDGFLEEQRVRGFALDRPPLLRLALVRSAEDLHHFVWTFHHIILDGWSVPLLAERAFAVYEALVRGESPGSWPSRPYREFVAWLAQQPEERARAFWEQRLGSARLPTALGSAGPGLPAVNGDGTADGHGAREVMLGADVREALEHRARRRRVTLATVLQGAWALLLAHYAQADDVVFGATVSGRPPQLPGVETMAGLFINTIPIRITALAAGEVWRWLAEEQRRRIEEQGYEHCSTAQIHQWLALPGGTPMFESILVFENYPIPDRAVREQGLELGVPSVRSEGSRTQFPLAIIVTPGDGLHLRLVHRRRNLDDDGAELIAGDLSELLAALASGPDDEDLSHVRAWVSRRPRPRYLSAGPAPTPSPAVPAAVPANGHTAALQSLWQELLRTDAPPDAGANFFDMGGQSLLALRLTREIRERFGAELSLQQVFQTPTVRGLAEVLHAGATANGAPAAITVPPLLTLLRPGATTCPLFLAPPGAGTPVCYSAAAAAIDNGQAVYGFQTPGLNGGERPLRSVAAIAECMVSSMRELQPGGPYRLGGWSFGAMVAWEAAAQLQAAGEEVESLILIDAGVEDPRAGRGVVHRAGSSAATLAGIASQVGVPRSWTRTRVLAQLFGVGLPDSPLRIGRGELEAARRSFASWYANTRASLGHEAGAFDGEVVLVRGLESRSAFPDPLQAQLSERTGGRLRVRSAPGNHMTMMLDPSKAEEVGEAVADTLKPKAARPRARRPRAAAAGERVAKKPLGEAVRIVAFDGTEAVGGTGYVAAALLGAIRDRLDGEQRNNFLGRTTIFAGTSAGSANALFLASTPDPDEALDAIEAFWIESELIASRGGVTPVGLARALLGLGSLLSTRKLRSFYLDHFGMTKLGELPHKVVIPSVCLDSPTNPGRWWPKAFHNLDPDSPDMERLVIDVLLSSSSPPLLTPVYQALSGEGPGYVDGGLWANNPSMAAIAMVASLRGNGSIDGIRVLSVSNGDVELRMQPRFKNGFGNLGYLGWLLHPRMPAALLNLMLTIEEDATAFTAEALLVEHFRRLDPDVPKRILDFSEKAIKRGINQILELEDTRTQVEDTVSWLSDVDWFGAG